MKRGDVVKVAAAGDCGKPRAAVIVQTDAFQYPLVVLHSCAPLGLAEIVIGI